MLHYLIELALWALAAYFAGGCVGCLLRKLFGAADEPVMAAASPAPAVARAPVAPAMPAPVAAPAPLARLNPADDKNLRKPMGLAGPRGGKADDLLRISGVGPKNRDILHGLGVFHFDQIAGWTYGEGDWVDDHMKFNGRVHREEWINQARLLAEGKEAEFSRLYGTGGEGAKLAGLRTATGPRTSGEGEAVALASVDPNKVRRPGGISKARGGKADDLQRISGVGPKNEKILHGLGVFHFDQIAAWTKGEVEWVDDHLKFGGRILREEWTRQASLLANGKEAEFLKQYGTGGLKGKDGSTVSGSRTRRK